MPSRIIREQCRRSKTLDGLTDFAERSWWRLITICDDYGCFEADFDLLISDLYPLKARVMKPQQIAAVCREWQEAGLVRFYADDEKIYGWCVSWAKHQRSRDSNRKFPDPDTHETVDIASLPNLAASRRRLPQSAARACTRVRAGSENEGIGYGAEGMEPNTMSASTDVPPVFGPEALVALYNTHKPAECPSVEKMTDERRRRYQKYLKQFPSEGYWVKVMSEMNESFLLRGLVHSPGHENFIGSLDWLCARGKDQVENVQKTYEGKYRPKPDRAAPVEKPQGWNVLNAIRKMEEQERAAERLVS